MNIYIYLLVYYIYIYTNWDIRLCPHCHRWAGSWSPCSCTLSRSERFVVGTRRGNSSSVVGPIVIACTVDHRCEKRCGGEIRRRCFRAQLTWMARVGLSLFASRLSLVSPSYQRIAHSLCSCRRLAHSGFCPSSRSQHTVNNKLLFSSQSGVFSAKKSTKRWRFLRQMLPYDCRDRTDY